MKRPVYLDHHATTPVDPEVLAAMLPYFTECHGNPASRGHAFGWQASEAVEEARAQVAACIGARADEMIFTSGATESNALAIQGCLGAAARRPAHGVTLATEHASVLGAARRLESEGVEWTVVGVARDGTVDPTEVEAAFTSRTRLVSVMIANNEIGTVAPVAEIARLARARGILVHTDATQAVGTLPVRVEEIGCDLLSLSAHKIYGPKGVGALYVRRRGSPVPLRALMEGGGQELGLRPGTLNVPGIVGFGRACALAGTRWRADASRLGALRDRLLERLLGEIDGVLINGTMRDRLPQNLNVSFEGVDGEALFQRLQDLAVSNGSACHSAHRRPSHVLRAIGRSVDLAHASIRFGLGRGTTADDMERTVCATVKAVAAARSIVAVHAS